MSGLIFGADYQLEALLSAAQEEYDCVRSSESVQTYENSTASGASDDQDCDQLPSCAELASLSLKKVVDIENIDGQVSTPVSYLSFDAFMHQLSEDKKRKRSTALEQSGNSKKSTVLLSLGFSSVADELPYKRQCLDPIHILPASTTMFASIPVQNSAHLHIVDKFIHQELSESRFSLQGVAPEVADQALLSVLKDPLYAKLYEDGLIESAMASIMGVRINDPVLIARYGAYVNASVEERKRRDIVETYARRILFRMLNRRFLKHQRDITSYIDAFDVGHISNKVLVDYARPYFSAHIIAAALNMQNN